MCPASFPMSCALWTVGNFGFGFTLIPDILGLLSARITCRQHPCTPPLHRGALACFGLRLDRLPAELSLVLRFLDDLEPPDRVDSVSDDRASKVPDVRGDG